MGLRLILGRSGSGKTKLCIDEILEKQKLEKNKNLIFIVPEQYSLQAEKDLINYSDCKGIMSAQVLSFKRLAYNILSQQGAIKRPVIDDITKTMILRKALINCNDNLEYFKKSTDKIGFVDKVLMTIREFYQYGVDLETIDKLLLENSNDIVYTAKLKDIRLIFQEYIKLINSNYISSDETLDIMTNVMEESEFLKDSEVWVDGFYGFTVQEFRVISKLLKCCENVNITLTIDERTFYLDNLKYSNYFFETWLTSRKLIKMCDNGKIKINKHVFLKNQYRFKNNDLRILEQQYFWYNQKGNTYEGNVRIFVGSNRYQEIENVSKEIVYLVDKFNFRYKDIAVMTRGLEDYQEILKTTFNEFDIPFFIDTKKDIISNPFIEFIRGIMDSFNYNFTYESMFRFIKTGLTPLTKDEQDILENYVLKFGIKGHKWFYQEWSLGFDEKNIENKEYINKLKNIITAPLMEFRNTFNKKVRYNVSDFTKGIFKIFEEYGVAEILQEKINSFNNNTQQTMTSEYIQCFNKSMDVFKSIDKILFEEKITFDEYTKILDSGLMSSSLGLIPPGIDQVLVGDIERSRFPKIKILFVVGTNEGIIPSPSEPEGIFSQVERNSMVEKGLELATSGSRKAFEEQFLIYSGLTKAEEMVILSYSMGNSNGKSMRPSSIISKIQKIFPDIYHETYDILESKRQVYSKNFTSHIIGIKLRQMANGFDDYVWNDILSFYILDNKDNNFLEKLLYGLELNNEEENLSDELTQRLYNNEMYSSVSRLERFENCPYSYFMEYILNIKERSIFSINTPDLGILYHRVLEGVSNFIENEGLEWTTIEKNQIDEIVNSIVDVTAPTLNNNILLSSYSNRYIVTRLKRISKRAVWALIEQIKVGKFKPFAYELGFGTGEKLPPITIELFDGTKLVMNGKIDRVDVYNKDGNSYVKIIDYKSGNKNFNLQDVYYGMQLQLIVYLSELCKMGRGLFGNEVLPGGMFYFKINDPTIKLSEEISDEELESLILKELKLSGLVLDDNEIINALDKGLNNNAGTSSVIPLGYNKNGTVKKESSVANSDDFFSIMKFSENKINDIGNQIRKGNIQIKPYKTKQFSSCDYCPYKSVCGFDEMYKGNSYRTVKTYDKETLLEKIRTDHKQTTNKK